MLQHLLATSPYADWLSALRTLARRLPRGVTLVALALATWAIVLTGGYLAAQAGELVRTVFGL